MLLFSLVTPLGLIGVIIVLVVRFGWPGIIIICVFGVLIPIQIFVGKIVSKYF